MTTTAQGTWVVAHFRDGRVLKGMTHDFAPGKPSFHLFPAHGAPSRGVTVPLDQLKAVYFVRTFDGNKDHVGHDTFRLDRENSKDSVAFGRGPHACVGAALARLELKVALEEILSAAPSFSLAREPVQTRFPEIGALSVPISFGAPA